MFAWFQIVTRLAIDHPHHALPVVLALVNAHKDSEVKEPVSLKMR